MVGIYLCTNGQLYWAWRVGWEKKKNRITITITTITKNNNKNNSNQKQLGEERVYLVYTSRIQPVIEGSQGRNLKVGLW